MVADLVAAVQQPDHLDGLLQHLQAHAGRRPRVAQDVLVERLAAADAQREPAVELDGRRGRGLREIAGWIRTVGQVTAVVTGSDVASRQRADHPPHERALALLVVPRVEVVGDPQPLEARLLGLPGLADSSCGPNCSQDRK